MDQKNADEWLKQAKAAMDEAAPRIVASVDGLLEQRAAIMEVGMRVLAQAAVRYALEETIGEMIAKILPHLKVAPDDGGAFARPFHQGGRVSKTAVRRFTQ